MKKALLLTIALATALFSFPSWAADPNVVQEQVKAEARRGFEEILDLWRGESYEALYYRLVALITFRLRHFRGPDEPLRA